MRLYDAYRLGVITQSEYNNFLLVGMSPNSMYVVPGNVDIEEPVLNYFSGITTSTMTDVLESNVIGSVKQSVSVRNLGSTNSMNVSIKYYVANVLSNTIDHVLVHSNVCLFETESAFQKIIISVQDVVPGSHTTFETGVSFS